MTLLGIIPNLLLGYETFLAFVDGPTTLFDILLF